MSAYLARRAVRLLKLARLLSLCLCWLQSEMRLSAAAAESLRLRGAPTAGRRGPGRAGSAGGHFAATVRPERLPEEGGGSGTCGAAAARSPPRALATGRGWGIRSGKGGASLCGSGQGPRVLDSPCGWAG